MPRNAILAICSCALLAGCAASQSSSVLEPSADDSSAPASMPGDESLSPHRYFVDEAIPEIRIDTEGGLAIDDPSLVIPDEHKGLMGEIPVYDYVGAKISVSNCEGYELQEVEGSVKVRGNYTSTYEKKPIRIKFSKKQAMCGLNEGRKFKSWVLLSEYKDPSMLRNALTDYLGGSLLSQHGEYCADFRFAKVYLNGSYNGLYLLTEQQQTGEGRVSIDEPIDPEKSEDGETSVKTGYFFEYDGYYEQEKELERFSIDYSEIRKHNGDTYRPNGRPGGWGWGNQANGFTIKSDIYTPEQNAFVKKCVQSIWDVVADATQVDHSDLSAHPYHTMDANGDYIADPTIEGTREAIEKVIDLNSLVDIYLLNEIAQDMDIGWSSFYFALDMSESGTHKLIYTAPWDFDSAYGNMSNSVQNNSLYAMDSNNQWLFAFGREKWFYELASNRYREIEDAGIFDGAKKLIDDYVDSYRDAFAENFARWPNSIGRRIDTQVDAVTSFRTEEDAASYLRDWLSERLRNLRYLLEDEELA